MVSVAPVIKRLVNNGVQIIWLTTDKYKYIVEKSGAIFEKYKIDFDNYDLSSVTSNFFELFKNLVELNQRAFEEYENYNFENSYIMYDSMCSFAKNIAYKKNIKSICLVTTMAFNVPLFLTSNMGISSVPLYLKNMRNFAKIVKDEIRFRKKHSILKFKMMDYFVNSADVTIVFSPKELQPCVSTFSKKFYFVGTTIKDRAEFRFNRLLQKM